MTKPNPKKNARIVRLRENGMPWRIIAERIAQEFPGEAVSHQRCKEIYDRDVRGITPATDRKRKERRAAAREALNSP